MAWKKRYRCAEVFLFGLVIDAFFAFAVGYAIYRLVLWVLP